MFAVTCGVLKDDATADEDDNQEEKTRDTQDMAAPREGDEAMAAVAAAAAAQAAQVAVRGGLVAECRAWAACCVTMSLPMDFQRTVSIQASSSRARKWFAGEHWVLRDTDQRAPFSCLTFIITNLLMYLMHCSEGSPSCDILGGVRPATVAQAV